jgi:anti-anti-sigma factor
MPREQLRLEITGSTARLVGELDLASRDRLLADLMSIASRHRVFTVDLGSVTFIDAAGLLALIEIERALRDDDRVLVLRNPRPNVRRVLDVTGLTWLLETATGESATSMR